MITATSTLRQHVLRIWHAAVEAVRSNRLVRQALRLDGGWLLVDDEPIELAKVRRIAVVGAGKAGAGMAAAVEEILDRTGKDFSGWVNVPADCVRPLRRITLHSARPAGVNEPTAEGVTGSEQILRLVESLTPDDLCLCLISGGGSALLPAPAPGVTLDDKQQITRFLSAAGANIRQLNTVRKQLSRIKGGGLLRACRAGRLIALIISDVLGDPLDIIASGPTVEDSSTPAEALAVLEEFGARKAGVAPAAVAYLEANAAGVSQRTQPERGAAPIVRNIIIGNNATAVAAAGDEAERLGYSFALDAAQSLEGEAESVGRHLAEMALKMRDRSGPNCLITGGEPVVRLVEPERRGLGGRNQQLVLAALERLSAVGLQGIAMLSGGTDGEDGPTDAAGAFIDEQVWADARARGLDLADYLGRNDAYHFFEPLSALIKTGPTHTNVCDVRVVVVDQDARAAMSRFRVLLTDYAWPDVDVERELLGSINAELIAAPAADTETLIGLAADVDAIMTCWAQVPAAVIEAAPRCRIVARLGVGLDNIDVTAATRRGMLVTNVPDYCVHEVAEHTLALLLALARKVAYYHHDTKQGRYDRNAGPALRRIAGQTLGIIGLGRIGREVARRAAGLGLSVVACSRGAPHSGPYESPLELPLADLLAESDFVSLHVPLTTETHHLIGATALARMKPTAYLINTARGGLVDHAALAAALASGKLAGAALDVQEPEPPDLSQPPWSDPRVIVTPHAAFLSQDSLLELRTRATRQVIDCLCGRTPPNVVNLPS